MIASVPAEPSRSPVLALAGVRVRFGRGAGAPAPVDGVDFAVWPGETLALLGESGCGKSLTALAAIGLLPRGARVEGDISLEGEVLPAASERAWVPVRGRRIGMIFQDPAAALNPLLTIGRQIEEALPRHHSRAHRRELSVALLGEVGIVDPTRRLRAYPHELSGGMCQRVMIAAALAAEPDLLIADEPTTALDVTVQAQILDLLARARRRRGMAMLLITHDLGVVVEAADRVAVMYAGRIVEQAPLAQLFAAPAHPYTVGLMRAVPRIEDAGTRFSPIAGSVPSPAAMPPGCRYAPRCPSADSRCRVQDPGLSRLSDVHEVRCWHPQASP